MTQDERDLITRFIERVGGTAAKPAGFGSVPGTQAAAPLPPVDPEADKLIGDLLATNPEAKYRLTQTAFVQEQALNQAQAQIKALTEQARQLQEQLAQAQQQPQPQRGGFLSSIFGGGAPQAPSSGVWNRGPAPQYAQPQPQYAPQYAGPGMMGGGMGMLRPQGSGFLGGALQTTAGVAGGVLVGNALMGLFEGHEGGHAGASLGDLGQGGQGPALGGASPWGNDAPAPDAPPPGGGFADNAGWNTDPGPAAAPDPGWTDASAAPDSGGWDTGGGGGGGDDSWS